MNKALKLLEQAEAALAEEGTRCTAQREYSKATEALKLAEEAEGVPVEGFRGLGNVC